MKYAIVIRSLRYYRQKTGYLLSAEKRIHITDSDKAEQFAHEPKLESNYGEYLTIRRVVNSQYETHEEASEALKILARYEDHEMEFLDPNWIEEQKNKKE